MNKNILKVTIGALAAMFSLSVNAQSVGIGTNTPSPNAALEISQGGSPQGLLIPKMSGVQMGVLETSLNNPQDLGMVIYNLDSTAFLFWDGSGFKEFGGTFSLPSGGTVSDYLVGDNTWMDFNTSARGALSGIAPVVYNSTSGVLSLGNSGVTAGTYGSGTEVPVVQVDTFGRVVSIGTATLPASLPAGGTSADYLIGNNTWGDFNSSVRGAVSAITPLSYNTVTGVVSLSNSGVTAGTYGSSAQIAQVSVDAYGRVTSISNVTAPTSPWTASGADAYFTGGTVGIGTSTPGYTFEVVGTSGLGNTDVSGALDVTGGLTSVEDFDVVGDVVIDNGTITLSDIAFATGSNGIVQTSGTGVMSKLDYSGTAAEVLRGDGSWGTIPSSADNLGDHNATGNIVTNGHYISNDSSNVGLYFDASNNTYIGNNLINPGVFVTSDGDVAIGHATPLQKFHMKENGAMVLKIDADADGDNNAHNAFIELTQDGGATGGMLGLQGVANTQFSNGLADALTVGTFSNHAVQLCTNGAAHLTVGNSGNVAIGGAVDPSYKLYVYGKLKSDGITEMSDRRLKQDVETLSSSLDKIQQLRGVNYNWRKENNIGVEFEEGLQVGLIAQEVEAVFPELVDTDDQGYKSVEYSKLVAVLIEALKEQELKISSLELQTKGLEDVKAEVEMLKAEISKYSMR